LSLDSQACAKIANFTGFRYDNLMRTEKIGAPAGQASAGFQWFQACRRILNADHFFASPIAPESDPGDNTFGTSIA
jgi:hypothetical protein